MTRRCRRLHARQRGSRSCRCAMRLARGVCCRNVDVPIQGEETRFRGSGVMDQCSGVTVQTECPRLRVEG
eukprot:3109294-Rhodomonas_salina.2